MSIEEVGWPTIITLAIALVFALFLALDAKQFAAMNFPLTLLGLATTFVAIKRTRRWWLMALVPLIAWPFVLLSYLLIGCVLTGNCL